jgi:transcriptional regulator with XRE-family HTH domain
VELGRRMAQARLARNLTQADLASRAGVSPRTLARLEAGGGGGEGVRLTGFIRVCRALELLDRLETMLPETTPSPLAQLKLAGRQRRRASRTAPTPPPSAAPPAWTWGNQP